MLCHELLGGHGTARVCIVAVQHGSRLAAGDARAGDRADAALGVLMPSTADAAEYQVRMAAFLRRAAAIGLERWA
jgi:hypothetical protein